MVRQIAEDGLCDDGEDVALGFCDPAFVEAIDDDQSWESGGIDTFCVQGDDPGVMRDATDLHKLLVFCRPFVHAQTQLLQPLQH